MGWSDRGVAAQVEILEVLLKWGGGVSLAGRLVCEARYVVIVEGNACGRGSDIFLGLWPYIFGDAWTEWVSERVQAMYMYM